MAKITKVTNEDKSLLKAAGVQGLPNNPSAKGLNANEIKRHFGASEQLIFGWLQRLQSELGIAFDDAPYFVPSLPADLSAYSEGDHIAVLNGNLTLYRIENAEAVKLGASLKETLEKTNELDGKVNQLAADITEYAEEVDQNFGHVFDRINKKQDKLVPGESLKTINGENLLGSGNIEIKGGSGVTEEELEEKLATKVDKSSVVQNIQNNPTKIASSAAIYRDNKAIRDQLAGKNKSMSLWCSETPVSKDDFESGARTYLTMNGTPIDIWETFLEYIRCPMAGGAYIENAVFLDNDKFDSQEEIVYIGDTVGRYLLLVGHDRSERRVLPNCLISATVDPRDNIYTEESGKPERWFDGAGFKAADATFQLGSYPRKTEDEEITGHWTFTGQDAFTLESDTAGAYIQFSEKMYNTTGFIGLAGYNMRVGNDGQNTVFGWGVIPLNKNSQNIGTENTRWNNIYTAGTLYLYEGASTDYGRIFASGNDILFSCPNSNGFIARKGSLLPWGEYGQTLGDKDNKWETLFAKNISDGTTTKPMSEVLNGAEWELIEEIKLLAPEDTITIGSDDAPLNIVNARICFCGLDSQYQGDIFGGQSGNLGYYGPLFSNEGNEVFDLTITFDDGKSVTQQLARGKEKAYDAWVLTTTGIVLSKNEFSNFSTLLYAGSVRMYNGHKITKLALSCHTSGVKINVGASQKSKIVVVGQK